MSAYLFYDSYLNRFRIFIRPTSSSYQSQQGIAYQSNISSLHNLQTTPSPPNFIILEILENGRTSQSSLYLNDHGVQFRKRITWLADGPGLVALCPSLQCISDMWLGPTLSIWCLPGCFPKEHLPSCLIHQLLHEGKDILADAFDLR